MEMLETVLSQPARNLLLSREKSHSSGVSAGVAFFNKEMQDQ
jgi:hypothetical protein